MNDSVTTKSDWIARQGQSIGCLGEVDKAVASPWRLMTAFILPGLLACCAIAALGSCSLDTTDKDSLIENKSLVVGGREADPVATCSDKYKCLAEQLCDITHVGHQVPANPGESSQDKEISRLPWYYDSSLGLINGYCVKKSLVKQYKPPKAAKEAQEPRSIVDIGAQYALSTVRLRKLLTENEQEAAAYYEQIKRRLKHIEDVDLIHGVKIDSGMKYSRDKPLVHLSYPEEVESEGTSSTAAPTTRYCTTLMGTTKIPDFSTYKAKASPSSPRYPIYLKSLHLRGPSFGLASTQAKVPGLPHLDKGVYGCIHVKPGAQLTLSGFADRKDYSQLQIICGSSSSTSSGPNALVTITDSDFRISPTAQPSLLTVKHNCSVSISRSSITSHTRDSSHMWGGESSKCNNAIMIEASPTKRLISVRNSALLRYLITSQLVASSFIYETRQIEPNPERCFMYGTALLNLRHLPKSGQTRLFLIGNTISTIVVRTHGANKPLPITKSPTYGKLSSDFYLAKKDKEGAEMYDSFGRRYITQERIFPIFESIAGLVSIHDDILKGGKSCSDSAKRYHIASNLVLGIQEQSYAAQFFYRVLGRLNMLEDSCSTATAVNAGPSEYLGTLTENDKCNSTLGKLYKIETANPPAAKLIGDMKERVTRIQIDRPTLAGMPRIRSSLANMKECLGKRTPLLSDGVLVSMLKSSMHPYNAFRGTVVQRQTPMKTLGNNLDWPVGCYLKPPAR